MARRGKGPRAPAPRHWDDPEPTQRERSDVQEARVAERLGARLTPNSGATPHAKGDADTSMFKVEMKRTVRNVGSAVTRAVLEKVAKEAADVGKHPVVVMTLEGLEAPAGEDWVLVQLGVFEELVDGAGPDR